MSWMYYLQAPVSVLVWFCVKSHNSQQPSDCILMLYPAGGTLDEDVAVNTTLLLAVSATDADGPGHLAGMVRYSISPGPGSDDFRIDSVTGVLSVARPLDYERQ